MPIKLRCQCGKTLNAPDSAAGKAVKCPGCAKALRVPAAGSAAPAAKLATAKPAATKPSAAKPQAPRSALRPTPSGADDIGSLFDEEGFSAKVESVCPSCRAEMALNAVLCTKCGYHKETGMQFERHKTAGVDIGLGALALEKAASDLVKETAMQKELLKGGGMPWWMLVLVLVIGGGGLGIAVLGVNAANQESDVERPSLVVSLLQLTSATFLFSSLVCSLIIAFHAFKQSIVKGLLTVFIPFYIIYFVIQNRGTVGKVFLLALVLGIGGAGAYWLSNNMPDSESEPDNGGLQTVL